MQDFLSGKASRAKAGSTVVEGTGWTVEAPGEEVRTDNTATNGYTDRIIAMKDLTATLENHWDASVNLMDSPVHFYVGQILLNVYLLLDAESTDGSTIGWFIPKAIVTAVGNPAKVGESVKQTTTIKNKGAFSPPTGTFTPSAAA